MQQTLKYISVDDDELDRLHIDAMASSFSFLQKKGSCSNAVEGIEMISLLKPDIVFADIEMPGINGIRLVQKIAGEVPAPVFITSHPEYALDGFELQVFDYLLKPVSSERFAKCALRLKDFFELRWNAFAFTKDEEHNFIVIKQGHDKYKLALDDIVYLEAMRDYTKLVTASKKYLVLETFGNMFQQLPPERFIRIHRSYIVNKSKIDSVQKNKISILSEELPVGKLYKHALDFVD